MTDTNFEIRLARSLQARADDAVEPFDASAIAEAAIAAARPRPGFLRMALAAATVAALVVGIAGAIVVGGLRDPKPDPSLPLIPSPDASASPEGAIGGGLILAYRPAESAGDCSAGSLAPFDVVTVDPATGTQTILGTTAEDCPAWGHSLNLQWAPDRQHILMTGSLGQEPMMLDTPTAAGRDLTFICCDLPTEVWQGGANQSQGWVLSPAGDFVAAIHTSDFQVPGEEGTTAIADGIVVANIDGSGRIFLPLPEGADIRGAASWSPDQSALVVAACLPCNRALLGQPATAENHEHLYVVPVDGSPVRELTDDATGYSWTPAWSPDGSTIAIARWECLSDWVPLQCSGEVASSMVLVDAESGGQGVVSSDEQLGQGAELGVPVWSPNSERIAFTASPIEDRLRAFVVDADGTNLVDLGEGSLMQWSPDGEWLLVSRSADAESFIDLWIVRADGSDARSLGTFLGSLTAPAAW